MQSQSTTSEYSHLIFLLFKNSVHFSLNHLECLFLFVALGLVDSKLLDECLGWVSLVETSVTEASSNVLGNRYEFETGEAVVEPFEDVSISVLVFAVDLKVIVFATFANVGMR